MSSTSRSPAPQSSQPFLNNLLKGFSLGHRIFADEPVGYPLPVAFRLLTLPSCCVPICSCYRWVESPSPSGLMNCAAFRFTPSSVVSFLDTPLALALSMISSLAFAPWPALISPEGSNQNEKRSSSKVRKVKRHLPRHPKRLSDWSIESCCVSLVPNRCQPTSSCPCFVSNLYRSP